MPRSGSTWRMFLFIPALFVGFWLFLAHLISSFQLLQSVANKSNKEFKPLRLFLHMPVLFIVSVYSNVSAWQAQETEHSFKNFFHIAWMFGHLFHLLAEKSIMIDCILFCGCKLDEEPIGKTQLINNGGIWSAVHSSSQHLVGSDSSSVLWGALRHIQSFKRL